MKLMTFETYRFGMSKEEILSFFNTKEFSFSEKKEIYLLKHLILKQIYQKINYIN